MKTLNLETLRFRAAILFLVGLLAIFMSSQLRANGTETLGPQVELLKQVSIDGVNFFDADAAVDLDVPVGVVGQTDATYKLIVKNIGSETLVDVVVSDATLGLSNVPVPGGPLLPNESRTIDSGDIGFGALFVAGRCEGTPGNKSDIASVAANGQDASVAVGGDNPANVRCIVGPEIVLLKQVSLTGGEPFFDADLPADAPVGLLGADATYRLIVRNVGDEDLSNILVSDSILGLVNVQVPDLFVGGEHVIDVGSFGEFQELFYANRCDSVGTKLNTASVSANGAITSEPVADDNPANVACEAPVACNILVDKTCSVDAPPADDMLCTSAIRSTTLRYTGPDRGNVKVTFEGSAGGLSIYAGIDLVNGLILTQSSPDGDAWTVDGETTGDGNLGSKFSIYIDNELLEVIHTSCSALYFAGAPAPLDTNSPSPSNSEKGDPSPNWFVLSFEQKDGRVVDATESEQQASADSCTVPFSGGNVTYSYHVTNTGTTDVDVTSVFDDKLGQLLESPPVFLAAGEFLNLTSPPIFINQTTTNTVLVDANVADNDSTRCAATDAVTVQLIEPCSECDGKVTMLTMQYNGSEEARVIVEQKKGGVVFDDIVQPGGQFTFSGTDKKDTLGTEISIFVDGSLNAKIHTSCSQPIGPGLVAGDFEVIEGYSRNGGLMCPVPR